METMRHFSRFVGLCFYLLAIPVQSKGGGGGCFDPTMQVTMADGSRKALMQVQLGDSVKSWNFETDSPTTSTVLDIPAFRRESLMELRLETGDVIHSTDDHPYWSHAKQRIVSRDPSSTLSLYELHANQLDDEELFVNEDRKPVVGKVSNSRRTASVIMDGVNVPDSLEVMTLRLNGSHWFYVQGILVHNKGSDGDDEREYIEKCGGSKYPCAGGRVGGVVLSATGAESYRRRRDDRNLPDEMTEECYVIDKSQEQCQDDENWNEDECKKASEKEYNANKACYGCHDDECIRSLCQEMAGACQPGSEPCKCGGWDQNHSDDKIKEECRAVDGECRNEQTYKFCCACFEMIQNNVKCDEREYQPSDLPIIIACLGAAAFALAGVYICINKICQARKMRKQNQVSEFSDVCSPVQPTNDVN